MCDCLAAVLECFARFQGQRILPAFLIHQMNSFTVEQSFHAKVILGKYPRVFNKSCCSLVRAPARAFLDRVGQGPYDRSRCSWHGTEEPSRAK